MHFYVQKMSAEMDIDMHTLYVICNSSAFHFLHS